MGIIAASRETAGFSTTCPFPEVVAYNSLDASAEGPMPTYFTCPNAQCSYQFDADILPPAAMVTCPLCRTRFPYRANRPVSAAAGPAPSAPPEGGADGAAPAGPRLVNLRGMPKSSPWPSIIAVGFFALFIIGLLVVVTNKDSPLNTRNTDGSTDERLNLKVEPFPPGWEEDSDVRDPVEANVIGRKRKDPEGYVAVVAKDWGDREPRTGELEELMRARLRAGFKTLEAQPVEGESWAGRPAQALKFTGVREDEHVRGEAYAFGYKGIGYAFFAWSAESNWGGLRDELVALREKVRPAGYREKWTPKKANTEVYPSDDGLFQVEDVDGAWLKGKPADQWALKERKYIVDDPKEIDSKAVMAFDAEYAIRERGDAKRQPAKADALVVELDGTGDAMQAAKAHVAERIKKAFAESPPEIKLEPLTHGTPLPSGGPAIGRFSFKNPQDRDDKNVWVISAIKAGGKTIAVECHAREKDASYVDEWMVHLAGSLKPR
jgi:hypothetical protein